MDTDDGYLEEILKSVVIYYDIKIYNVKLESQIDALEQNKIYDTIHSNKNAGILVNDCILN